MAHVLVHLGLLQNGVEDMDMVQELPKQVVARVDLEIRRDRDDGRLLAALDVGVQEGPQVQALVEAVVLEDRPGQDRLDVDVAADRVGRAFQRGRLQLPEGRERVGGCAMAGGGVMGGLALDQGGDGAQMVLQPVQAGEDGQAGGIESAIPDALRQHHFVPPSCVRLGLGPRPPQTQRRRGPLTLTGHLTGRCTGWPGPRTTSTTAARCHTWYDARGMCDMPGWRVSADTRLWLEGTAAAPVSGAAAAAVVAEVVEVVVLAAAWLVLRLRLRLLALVGPQRAALGLPVSARGGQDRSPPWCFPQIQDRGRLMVEKGGDLSTSAECRTTQTPRRDVGPTRPALCFTQGWAGEGMPDACWGRYVSPSPSPSPPTSTSTTMSTKMTLK